MPRQEHVLSIFVASPGDVEDERSRLEEIIRELNVTWSRELGIRLELLRWETRAYPGLGDDAQAVINDQIPNDYDVFIGIMWHRFGTPTGRAGSGTIEEFEQAKARYDENPLSIRIMFYFKDTPVSPSRVNPEQLGKVAAFRKSLGKEGMLYWTFNGLEEFEKLLRLHVTRQVQAWHNELKSKETEVPRSRQDEQEVATSETGSEDDDLGLLDLAEILEDRFNELAKIAQHITNSTAELGAKMATRTDEINNLVAASKGNVDRNVAKRLIAKAASDMDQYVARMEAELPLFGKNLNEGMDALIRAATITVEIEATDAEQDQAREGLQAIVSLRETLDETEVPIQEFRTTVAALPRMTSILNKSKRKVVTVLDQLIEELRSGQSLTREAEQLVRDLLDEPEDEESGT